MEMRKLKITGTESAPLGIQELGPKLHPQNDPPLPLHTTCHPERREGPMQRAGCASAPTTKPTTRRIVTV